MITKVNEKKKKNSIFSEECSKFPWGQQPSRTYL